MAKEHEKTRPRNSLDIPRPVALGYGEGFPRLGTLLLGRYEIFQVRQGGFGLVLCVTDQETGEDLAIKMPIVQQGDLLTNLETFESEVSFWLKLDPHPNIVKALFVREVEGRPALFMEYIGGTPFGNLREWLDSGSLTEDTAISFAFQISLAMEFANRQGEVAHLDLKPQNMLVTGENDLKVTDFGSAQRVRMVSGSYPTSNVATWEYAAPEIFEGHPGDTRSDIYSFGVIFYEMLTGQLPFPFELSGNSVDAYRQMLEFHEQGRIEGITEQLYYHGIPGYSGQYIEQFGIILSSCLQHYQGSRSRSFSEIVETLEGTFKLKRPQSLNEALSADELIQRAMALRTVGRVDEALSRFNALIVKYPNNAVAWLEAARTLEGAGHYEQARQFEKRAMALDPNLREVTRLREPESR